MKGKISYVDQNHFLHQAVNAIFSAVTLGILTWGVGLTFYWSHWRPVDERQYKSLPCWFQERAREIAACFLFCFYVYLFFVQDFKKIHVITSLNACGHKWVDIF